MKELSPNVLAVAGSLKRESVTRVVIHRAAALMEEAGCTVDILDLLREPLPLYNPDTCQTFPGFSALKARVDRANILLLGTPDYHGGMSSAMKNFLDYFWHEFAGKLFVPMVASHEKGLTAIDALRTTARQCYAWVIPYGISFAEKADVHDGQIISESLQKRLEMVVHDARVYGQVLAQQRRADLADSRPGFMAKHR